MTEGKPAKARRFELIEELYGSTEIQTTDLARRFHVSPNLVSNDLKALENLGLVVRTRGRARWAPLLPGDLFGNTLLQHQWNDPQERVYGEALAAFVAATIVAPGSLFLDEGVVPTLVAKELAQFGKTGVSIVTTNLAIPIVLARLGIPLPCDLMPGRLALDRMCVVPSHDDLASGKGFVPSVAVVVPHAMSANGDLYVADRLFGPIKDQVMRDAGAVVVAVEASRIGPAGGSSSCEVQTCGNSLVSVLALSRIPG